MGNMTGDKVRRVANVRAPDPQRKAANLGTTTQHGRTVTAHQAARAPYKRHAHTWGVSVVVITASRQQKT